MKNSFAIFLILVFMLPTFGPWMPHDSLQTLHIQQESHHQSMVYHGHHNHDEQAKVSHSVNFDVVTYFSDYLHVDLKSANHAALNVPAHDKQAIDYRMDVDILSPPLSQSSGIQITGLADYDWRMSRPGPPVYLTTQRLRI
jgi:hypothetical protein